MTLFLTLWRRYGLIVLAAVMTVLYLRVGLTSGGGQPLMPVDDAYIHFQYAKQAALGQPFVYSPSDGATSGATSLIYPFILSAGWLAGFRELALGYWAVLVGGVSLVASAIFTRRIVRAGGGDIWLAEGVATAFILCGTVVWHATSGMETVLACALTLATFDGFVRQSRFQMVTAAALLTVTRPEGGVLAALACGVALLREWRSAGVSPRLVVYGLPVLLIGLQPAINFAMTGTMSATGGQAKSLLSLIPADWGYIFERVLTNFTRMWGEFILGTGEGGVWFMPPLMGGLAIVGAVVMGKRKPAAVILLILWALALTGAVSTLDTAFWHFKRYQMPLMVLTFPLVGWLLTRLPRRWGQFGAVILIVSALGFGWPFLSYYQQNTESVAAQPLQMARWFRENALDASVAVHDVGMMGYYGGVRTVDMVGLTTPNAADAWRNGPGAVGEWLMSDLPDYYAAYDEARGLNYLVAALESVPPGVLADFVHDFTPATNVALGGRRQVIISMTGLESASPVPQNGLLVPILAKRYALVDSLDVADLVSERAHGYQWREATRTSGFPSEFYRLTTLGCAADCTPQPDGGRRITGGESFTLHGTIGASHVLVTRVHPVNGGTVTISINGAVYAERLIPAQPGQWFEFWTALPSTLTPDGIATIDIAAHIPDGAYMPYQHWLYAETTPVDPPSDVQAAVQFGRLNISLAPVETLQTEDSLTVRLTWHQQADDVPDLPIDAVAFAHLYADLDQPPVAQVDARPGRGAYPPADWDAPVTGFTDEFVLDLTSLAPGAYMLAVGMYAPMTFERFAPDILWPTYQEDEGRVLVGEIVVK